MLKKFFSTLHIVSCLLMARTFGKYRHSIGDAGQPNFAVYRWNGKDWWVPTEGLKA
jgi:hypothetical protein